MMKKLFSFLIFGFITVSAQNYGLIADKICADIKKIPEKDSIKVYLKQQEIIFREEQYLIENIKQDKVQKFDILNEINIILFNTQRETLKKCGNTLISKDYRLLPSTKVLDLDNVFNQNEISTLNIKIKNIRSEYDLGILIVEASDYFPANNIIDFSYLLLEKSDSFNKGKLIIVFNKKERVIRISTDSKSKEFLSDEFLQNLIDNEVPSEFRKGNYYKGIENCLTKIENAL